jgi:class 3 adenylate cyclase
VDHSLWQSKPERGLVTVLFADLAGFTDFCERAGEEAAYQLMQHLTKLLREFIEAQGGSVRSFTGDRIMALFGVPRALEDGPLRACRAALLIQKELSAQSAVIQSRYGLWPQLRIGISAGLAIIGRVESNEDSSVTALGDTVNVAARLQALAQPGAVMLSEATQRLVEGIVESRFAGEHRIKSSTP